jgi:hypothetical protein
MLECSCKSRFSFTSQTGKSGYEFSDCRIKVAGDRAAMNVVAREREARTCRKPFFCATMATQHDIGRERIIREATYGANLFSRKSTQSVARAEVMSRDMNG